MIVIFIRLAPHNLGLQSYLQEVNANFGALETVLELDRACAQAIETRSPQADTWAPLLTREIRAENVTYQYPDQKSPALDDISCSIPVGSVTTVIGPTGGGKSTFVDILMGLIAPTYGNLFDDGVPLDASRRATFRDQIGFVPQETILFNETIRFNLQLGAAKASDNAIIAVLECAGARAFVERLPGDLDMRVGDRGQFLSGGERQRLAFARAVLRAQPKKKLSDFSDL